MSLTTSAQCTADAAAIQITGTTATETSICVDGIGDPIDVEIVGVGMGATNGWVITDNATGIILGLPAAPPFDLDGAGGGVCDIWYYRYDGMVTGLSTGENIADVTGCFDVSNPITVTRNEPDGAAIQIAGTSNTEATICVDGIGDPIDVEIVGTGVGANSSWVITDNATGTILGLPAAPPFDLDGAGGGVCDIWYLRYENGLTGLTAGANVADLMGCFDFSNPITVTRNEPDAAAIQIAGTSDTEILICVDGVGDPIDVEIVGTGVGANNGWVITDNATGTILGLPAAPPFDLDGAGIGVCDIWYLRYDGTLTGLTVGENVGAVTGCFDLSNPITVNREAPDGGTIQVDVAATGNPNNTTSVSANGLSVVICVDGRPDPLVVEHTTTAPNLTFRYAITDASDTILAFAATSTIDLDGAGVGACKIWGWSYQGVNQNDFIGLPIGDLDAADCSDVSDESILVVRQAADGGSVEIDIAATGNPNNTTSIAADGLSAVICVDGNADPIVVSHLTTAAFLTYKYVITDSSADNTILAFTDSNTIDLDGAGIGTCRIWGWSYRGLDETVFLGMPLTNLDAEDCSDISDEWIDIIREEADGGSVALDNGDTEITICAGDGIPDPMDVVHTNTAVNLTYNYVITDSDAANTILGISSSATIDLEGAGEGVCRIWGWSYRGLDAGTFIGAPLADLQAEDCSAISTNFVEVTRLTGNDCVLANGDITDTINFSIFPNPANDQVQVRYEDTSAQITVTVYDISGRIVAQKEAQGDATLSFDVSTLQSGTYVLNLTDESRGITTTKRLVKR